LACGAAANNPIRLLLNAYLVVPCHNFKEYICRQNDGWLNEKLTGMTHKTLMIFADCKCDNLKTKEILWEKSPDNEEIMAMSAALNTLKGHLMLSKKLRDFIKGKDKGKGMGKGKGKDCNKKTKKKKNTGHKTKQKEDEAWKNKVPSKDGDKKSNRGSGTSFFKFSNWPNTNFIGLNLLN
jgi:hypothetical protein